MNLLPEEHLKSLEQKKKIKKYTLLVSLIIFVMIASYASVYFIEYNKRVEISAINQQIEELQKIRDAQMEIVAEQEVLDTRENMLKTIEDKRVDHYKFLQELENTIPDEIALESIAYPSEEYFDLHGKTIKPNELAAFMTNIAKIQGVENVFIESVHFDTSQSEQENNPDFNIHFTYQGEQGGQNNDLNE